MGNGVCNKNDTVNEVELMLPDFSNPGQLLFLRVSDFTCDCLPGYSGPTCEQETDPCEANPCQNGATCTRVGQTAVYTCDNCPADYTGQNCDTFIPCSTNPCGDNGSCENSDDFSSYTCTCDQYYQGDTCDTVQMCNFASLYPDYPLPDPCN